MYRHTHSGDELPDKLFFFLHIVNKCVIRAEINVDKRCLGNHIEDIKLIPAEFSFMVNLYRSQVIKARYVNDNNIPSLICRVIRP